MAKIIHSKGKSTYDTYRRRGQKRRFFLYLLALLGVVGAYFTYGISLVLCISLLFLKKDDAYDKILASGEAGEKATENVLRKLPRSYYVIGDVTIEKPTGKSQLDHLVIGPNGVFVVETKNHKGIISGDDSDVKVLQQKQVRGMWQDSRFLNPTKQVTTHMRAVRNFMERVGYKGVPVSGAVFFANPEAKVRIYSEEMPVFSAKKGGARKLRRYIRKKGQKGYLDAGERKDLANRFAKRKV